MSHKVHFKLLLVVGVLLAGLVETARCDIIFSQGSSVTGRGNGLESDADVSIFRVQKFTVSTATTIKLSTWSGIYMPASSPIVADSFNIVIFGDTGTGPDYGNILFNGAPTDLKRVDSGYDIGTTLDIYDYSGQLPDIAIGAGTYWYSIANNTSGESTYWNWLWDSTDTNLGRGRSLTSQTTGYTVLAADNVTGVFALYDTAAVPEPACFGIVLIGSAFLYCRRRKRLES